MYAYREDLARELDEIRESGLYKNERLITTPQDAHIDVQSGCEAEAATKDPEQEPPILNFCANNYLGLANHPRIVAAARDALDRWGFGMASVRFICGTETQHHEFEQEIAAFLGTDDSILFSSCFDANGAIFDVLLGPDDAIVSDALNHASIIDGIRLCKAKRYRYANADMEDLRIQLEVAAAAGARRIMIVTDGVFSMDGKYAPLPQICDIADEFEALVMVDDSHATGFVGQTGRGTPERFGVADRIDILSGTLGKALGGASGGYIAAHQEIVDLLRQRARPYLFSNSVAPSIVAAGREALRLVDEAAGARVQIERNAQRFRAAMSAAGFDLIPGEHAIIPVMFPGEDGARMATQIADQMQQLGVFVTAFSFPVVPRGQARIRVQLSAAHSDADVDRCVKAFIDARDKVAAK